MHIASPDICERVGDCLLSNHPPAVFASDAVRALDEARVGKGVVFSSAYLYGLASLDLEPTVVAAWTRRENEFTETEVGKYPGRLIGFLSVDPMQPSAIDEIRHWQNSEVLVGLKLHFAASAVNLQSEAARDQIIDVMREAAAGQMPMVIHIGGGDFDGQAAEDFIQNILPSAGRSWVQIAHAGGGYPFSGNNHVGILRAFADHIEQDDPVTQRVLFDLSYVPAPEENSADATALTREMRRIGLNRFLFGSDFNVLTPTKSATNLGRLALTTEEQQTFRENCAPWACPDQ